MNSSTVNAPRPLIELLGARWTMKAPVVAAAWDSTGTVVGFGLGDGSLALAPGVWEGGPVVRPREGGGIELAAATAAARPVARAGVHGGAQGGACLSLVADPTGGFLSGGDDGVLAHTDVDGITTAVATHPGAWADPVAAGATGLRACAVNRTVHVFGPETATVELPSSVGALAFDPSGKTLAIAHHGGVTLWTAGGTRLLPWAGTHRALAWSPDGQYVVSGMQENVLHGWRVADGGDIECGGYPGQPRCLSFDGAGRFLATSGGTRVVCWRFDPPGGDPTECGIDSAVPVSVVACHPRQALIAAGYVNGAILLCQPGVEDILFVRGSGAGPVTALAWSADGAALALGTQDGEIAVVGLPSSLFRFGQAKPSQTSAP